MIATFVSNKKEKVIKNYVICKLDEDDNGSDEEAVLQSHVEETKVRAIGFCGCFQENII